MITELLGIGPTYLGIAFGAVVLLFFGTQVAGSKMLSRKHQRAIRDEIRRIDRETQRKR